MQACSCPRCGAAVPLTFASIHGLRCRWCSFEGPPPPEAAQRLLIAQRELGQLDARARQFDAAARQAIGRALRARWGVWVLLVLGALPFVTLAVVGVVMAAEHVGPVANRVTGAFFICVPALLYVTAGSVLMATVVAARRRLLVACAAVPPIRAGEPASCAVCGAALVLRGVDPIVRCDHCGSDSVVHPSSMAQASARRGFDLDALTFSVRGRSEAIVATARRAALGTLAAVFGTPAVAFASVLAMLLLAKVVEPHLGLAPSELERYAWVHTKRGRCVGMISRDGEQTQAYFGGNDRLPNPKTIPPDEAADLKLFSLKVLVGTRIRLANGTEGVVQGLTGAPVTNREQLLLEGGKHGDAAGACEPKR